MVLFGGCGTHSGQTTGKPARMRQRESLDAFAGVINFLFFSIPRVRGSPVVLN